MKKLLIFVLVVVVLVVGAAQFLLPSMVTSRVQKQLEENLKPQQTTLQITSTPAVKMLFGDIDVINGELEKVKLGALTFDKIIVDVKGLALSPTELWINKQLVVIGLESGNIEGIVTDTELQAFLEERVKGLEVTKVSLQAEKIAVDGNIDIGGIIRGKATVNGSMVIKNNRLVFVPQQFSIDGITISGLTAGILKDIEIYDFAKFPIPVTAKRIDTEAGALHVYVEPNAK